MDEEYLRTDKEERILICAALKNYKEQLEKTTIPLTMIINATQNLGVYPQDKEMMKLLETKIENLNDLIERFTDE